MNSEFSRRVEVDQIGPTPEQCLIEADEAQRAAIARRLDLVALERFAADLTVERAGAGRLRLSGRISAKVVQTCVVSLQPMTTEIAESFTVLYASPLVSGAPGDVSVGLEEEEAPEPLEGGTVDIGEAATQQLALSLDPYPRKPDAVPPAFAGDKEGASESGQGGPFAVLATLKKRG